MRLGVQATGILGPALTGLQGLCHVGGRKGSPRGQAGLQLKGVGARIQILSLSNSTEMLQKPGKSPIRAGPFPRLYNLHHRQDPICRIHPTALLVGSGQEPCHGWT